MQDPLNPLDNQAPLDNPMLDALEHRTKYPTGFMDPLAKYDYMLMDDIGRQLQNLEASIDDSLPVFDIPDIGKNDNKVNIQNGNVGILEPSMPPDNLEPSETVNDLRSVFKSLPPPVPQDSSNSTFSRNLSPPKSRHRGGGCSRKKQGSPLKKNIARQSGRTNAGISSDLRYCLDSHELVDKETCESCEKYRHWPEVTNEDPKECWHDWQLAHSYNSDESDGNDG